jgi:signal transduction histidine kinase
MIAAKNQPSSMVWAAILVAIAGCVSTYGLLILADGAISWAVVAASLGALLILMKEMRSRPGQPDSSLLSHPAVGELSARLLTIQEEERKSLSRELHDGVGQAITALKMELARLKVADGADAERLRRARELADETLRTIRNISLLLRPTALDDLGLEAALQWQAEDFSRRTSVRCQLDCSLSEDASIPESVKTCVYRVVQEALNNCEKHARASTVRIEIRQDLDGIVVSIADDGQGIPAESLRTGGLGILGMKERASMLGGRVELRSEARRGTQVTLTLPSWRSYASKGSVAP